VAGRCEEEKGISRSITIYAQVNLILRKKRLVSHVGWFLQNIAVVGWCLQALLNWCSTKDIGVFYRLVHANIVLVGWYLHDPIK
jgi:hypothetical protein